MEEAIASLATQAPCLARHTWLDGGPCLTSHPTFRQEEPQQHYYQANTGCTALWGPQAASALSGCAYRSEWPHVAPPPGGHAWAASTTSIEQWGRIPASAQDAPPWQWDPTMGANVQPTAIPLLPSPAAQQYTQPPPFAAACSSHQYSSCSMVGEPTTGSDNGCGTVATLESFELDMECLVAEIERAPWPAYPAAGCSAGLTAAASGFNPSAGLVAAAACGPILPYSTALAAAAAAGIVGSAHYTAAGTRSAPTTLSAAAAALPIPRRPPSAFMQPDFASCPAFVSASVASHGMGRSENGMWQPAAGAGTLNDVRYDTVSDSDVCARGGSGLLGAAASGALYNAIRATFGLPLSDAARMLGMSGSELKRHCRAHGVERWPQRKLTSVGRGGKFSPVPGAAGVTAVYPSDAVPAPPCGSPQGPQQQGAVASVQVPSSGGSAPTGL
ncbi:hypothetical protein TSOC_001533 [Tetrabaena socialis]|uniref:RWP-RK domain-containing protein n=1 Tax=Tetrabaena socialis TaxID=47790 RepID=A0A2J8AGL0_9CHLO|nr:hypothetical protein TSOC_001533 [Tetrabaena socialis]|eukprot:PNH11654.1 hypothetical protein TSOC_001533 [Tetrabaena socialis]